MGEGSSAFSQLSLTYMEWGDNNKCLCVRALKEAPAPLFPTRLCSQSLLPEAAPLVLPKPRPNRAGSSVRTSRTSHL